MTWKNLFLIRTSKFDRMPDGMKIEKISIFLEYSIGLILNLIQGHLTILRLKKEAVGF